MLLCVVCPIAPEVSIMVTVCPSLYGITVVCSFVRCCPMQHLNFAAKIRQKEVAATASPTLVLHGLKDQVVPHTHSLDLYRASAASKKVKTLLAPAACVWCLVVLPSSLLCGHPPGIVESTTGIFAVVLVFPALPLTPDSADRSCDCTFSPPPPMCRCRRRCPRGYCFLFFYFSVQYVGLLLESDHNRISWDVVCDMYARPFMEMVCPGQR